MNSEVEKIIVMSEKESEIRIAILENGELVELFFEDIEGASIMGNIYLGRVENVIPSLEAYFVNIGTGKNAFLRFKDVQKGTTLNKGSKVLVQVKKDPRDGKGAQITTFVNLVGRYVIYLPFKKVIGISRKIADPGERQRLRKLGKTLTKHGGVIFRTLSEGIGDSVIIQEFEELVEKWEEIVKKFKRLKKPQLIHEKPDLISYIMRERCDNTVKEIVYDSSGIGDRLFKLREKMGLDFKMRIIDSDAFEIFNIYSQMEELLGRVVSLPSGGNIVVDHTEAMTVIDVNTASNVTGYNLDEAAHRTNLEAAKEIARQLRLRNIGGIILVDFIRGDAGTVNEEEYVDILEREATRDKGKVRIEGFTKLGLLEITRKRTKRSLDASLTIRCPICMGTGRVISPKMIYMKLLKELKRYRGDGKIRKVKINVFQNLSGYLLPSEIRRLERELGKKLEVKFTYRDPRGYEISVE